jgi:hypothetical protein
MALPPMRRQQRLQRRPLRITQVMPFQRVLIRGVIQAERSTKIYGIRPRRGGPSLASNSVATRRDTE